MTQKKHSPGNGHKNIISKIKAQKEQAKKEQVKKEQKESDKNLENQDNTALETKVSDLEKVINSLNDKLLRSLADNDNLRKRHKEELEKAHKYATFNFISELVVVMENFYLAVDNMPKEEIEKNPQVKNFADAVIMTKKELTKIFEKNAVTRLYPLKEKFDHNYHQAITQIESEEQKGTIAQVIQAGYIINDRLIRPALVGVSKGGK